MKFLSRIVPALLILAATPAFAKPSGLALEPVNTVTVATDVTTIEGYMPLQGNNPGNNRQRNAAVFPTDADTVGCTAVAEEAAQNGGYFIILGDVASMGAVQGVFTMTFSSLRACYVNY